MAFQALFNLESIKGATQATLILETLNVLLQLQQKAEKALDVPLLVTTTALWLLDIQLVAAKMVNSSGVFTFLFTAVCDVRRIFYMITCLTEVNTNFSVVTLKCSEIRIGSMELYFRNLNVIVKKVQIVIFKMLKINWTVKDYWNLFLLGRRAWYTKFWFQILNVCQLNSLPFSSVKDFNEYHWPFDFCYERCRNRVLLGSHIHPS